MKIIKNIPIKGKHDKPILTDFFYLKNDHPKPAVIFCHGYKGYKDWGAWNLVAEQFANQNIFFIKINFSHNGGTIEQPIDFPDLEAFGNNNFIIELNDLNSVIDSISQNNDVKNEIDLQNISLVGHSRGGGIVLIKASEDARIKKVITWAGVSDFASRFPQGQPLNEWKKNGVAYITNARTNQQMPHYIQFYSTFKENEDRLNIKSAVERLRIPYLIIHGANDETVLVKEAENMLSWNSKNKLQIIDHANHTFNSKQPWDTHHLPENLKIASKKTIDFIFS